MATIELSATLTARIHAFSGRVPQVELYFGSALIKSWDVPESDRYLDRRGEWRLGRLGEEWIEFAEDAYVQEFVAAKLAEVLRVGIGKADL